MVSFQGVTSSGLNLNTSAGEISGTPTVVETQDFTVEVASGDGQNAQQALSITVNVLPTLEPGELCSDNPASAIATFEDANLEAAIRNALAVGAQDDLTCGLISGLTDLPAGGVLPTGPHSITSLVGIQNLTGLATLELGGNLITDISSLSGLTSLTYLSLSGLSDFSSNIISDISPLSGLALLTDLRLHSTRDITDLSPLSGLTGLTQLRIGNNSITDISLLSGLTGLTFLSLSGSSDVETNVISDISVLSGLTNLTELRLNNTRNIVDLSPLSALTGLTQLRLRNNLITDIRPLFGLTSLEGLNLAANPYSDVSALSGLTNLTFLAINGSLNGPPAGDPINGKVTDISALSGMTSMTFLWIGDNPITDISALSGMTSLEHLNKGVTVTSDCTPAPVTTTLSVTGVTDPITAGASSDVTVTARDGSGNVTPGYTGTVAFASSDTLATLPANYTFVGGDSGVHTFTGGVTFAAAGEHSVTATDVAVGTITGSQTAITVQAAGAATLSVTGITDPITADASSDVTVTALDQFGNVATGYTGTVAFTSSDGAATLPANYTFTGPDGGIHVFAGGVTLATVGEQSVTATDVAVGTITGSQTAITVQAAPTNFIVLGDIVLSSISAAAEVDFYRFTGATGDVIVLTLIETTSFGSIFNFPQVTVFAPSGTQVTTFGADRAEQVTLPENGTYLIQLQANNLVSTGNYNLGLEGLLPLTPGATPLSLGDLLPGSFDTAGTVDNYTYEGTGGDVITTVLVETSSFGSIFNFPQVTIYTPSLAVLRSYGGDALHRDTLPETGSYTLTVRPNNLVSAGDYRLNLTGLQPLTPGRPTAQCGQLVAENIGTSGEIDLYTFDGQDGQLVVLTFVETSDFGSIFNFPVLRVLSPSLNQLLAVNADGQQQLTLSTTGTHLFQVTANNIVSTGTYTLNISCP